MEHLFAIQSEGMVFRENAKPVNQQGTDRGISLGGGVLAQTSGMVWRKRQPEFNRYNKATRTHRGTL